MPTPPLPHDPFRAALLGLAAGDALGAPAEFASRAEVARRFGRLTEMVGGGTFGWAPGEWTDDTAMSMAVAEGLLADPAEPLAGIGARFLAWAPGAPDVGSTIRTALDALAGSWPEAARRAAAVHAPRTAGNGSLMRTLPVALAVPGRAEVQRLAARISAMTHWDAQAESCCAVYCLWVREALAGAELRAGWERAVEMARHDAAGLGPGPEAPGPVAPGDRFWDRLAAAPERREAELRATGYVVDSLEAAVASAAAAATTEEGIVAAANLGDDADTVAAIAGGALGAFRGAPPERWLALLHRRAELEGLADRLRQLRHELVYAPGGPPPFRVAAVDDLLLAGRNPLTEVDVLELVGRGVGLVVDLREASEYDGQGRHGREAVAALARHGVERLHLPVPDFRPPREADFDRAWEALAAARAAGRRAYLHCRAGIERTGAFLVALDARRSGRSPRAALAELQDRGTGIAPLPEQLAAAAAWCARHRTDPV